MPDDVEIVGVVTIGHPAPRRTPRGSRKKVLEWKPLDEVVHWEHW